MKYPQPPIVNEILAAYRANEKALKESAAVHAALHHAFSSRKKKASLPEMQRCAGTIKKLKLALELMHFNLYRIASSPRKYFSAPGISFEDITLSQSFLHTASANCGKAFNTLLKAELLFTEFVQGTAVSPEPSRIDRYFRIISLYLENNTSCMLFLLQKSRVNHLFRDIETNKEKYHFPMKNLQRGDVVLFYKTAPFLRKHALSLLISLSEGSPVTHSTIIASKKGEKLQWLASEGYGRKIKLADVGQHPGEILLVFRPRISSAAYAKLGKSIDAWIAVLSRSRAYGFSLWQYIFATIEGLLSRFVGHLGRRIILVKNPFQQRSRMFCSEFVNRIFYDAGILLSPRSLESSLISPAEFSFSPVLEFVGVIGDAPEIPDDEGERV